MGLNNPIDLKANIRPGYSPCKIGKKIESPELF